jgi:hypothetical protein
MLSEAVSEWHQEQGEELGGDVFQLDGREVRLELGGGVRESALLQGEDMIF